MNTADILDKAADLIDQRGLAKGWFCGPGGTLCAAGGIYAALGAEPQPAGVDYEGWPGWNVSLIQPYDRAWTALYEHLGGCGIGSWNDVRTKEEVVTTLRAAARAARAEQ